MRRVGLLLLAAALVLPVGRLLAHVRLAHPLSGTLLHWSSPTSIPVVIQADGSDDVPDGSDAQALRLALQDWNAVSGSSARLLEDTRPSSTARRDHQADDVHLLLFDEDNSSGYFPPGSATVAVTPVWFFANGVIQDADVLFNGAGFSFTTRAEAGRFDVQDVAAHELGHLLGLDHSGNVGATLYPYIDEGVVLQRSLSQDEVVALREAYPAGSFARLGGTVLRAEDGRPVPGAYVVARDEEQRTVSASLADGEGNYTLQGLAPGRYTLYARPFDGPVEEDNLGGYWAGRIATDFEPAPLAQPVEVAPGETLTLEPLFVGADVTLSLGRSTDRFPMRATLGASQTFVLHGSGLFVGSSLSAADPDLVLSELTWLGTQVSFRLDVPAGEAPGQVDLEVTNASGRRSILSAALELVPAAPEVHAVLPAEGTAAGGETLSVHGAGFRPGARVVLGQHIFTDPIDCRVLDEGTLTFVSAVEEPGLHDLVVIDPSGVEGRRVGAFRVRSAPVLRDVLPRGGSAAGGTEVVLAGSGFLPGLSVRIDGVEQGPVTLGQDGTARFTTQGGAPGGPLALELENPDGARATLSFVYAAQPDPSFAGLVPTSGTSAGGTALTLQGSGFTPEMRVAFLAELGGEESGAVRTTFVDEHTLLVETPAHAAGTVALLIADASECGVLAEAAFTFTSEGGGAGGGCSTVPFREPRGPREVLAGAWWLVLVFLTLGLRSLRARRTLHPRL